MEENETNTNEEYTILWSPWQYVRLIVRYHNNISPPLFEAKDTLCSKKTFSSLRFSIAYRLAFRLGLSIDIFRHGEGEFDRSMRVGINEEQVELVSAKAHIFVCEYIFDIRLAEKLKDD